MCRKKSHKLQFFRAKRRDTGFLRSGRCWPVGIDESCYGTGSFGFRRDISERRIGKKARPNVYAKRGVALVPESRKTEGLLLKNTIAFNISLPVLDRFMRGMRVDADKEAGIVEQGIDALKIKAPSPNINCSTLSGGNQQKVLLAKWLATDPEVLILDEPTRGIDVGAKAEIYTIINNLAKEGLAIILISSEMPEVMNMSDRVVIMHEGRITGELAHQDGISQEMILTYAMGVNKNE